ncbi:MAG: hypothetical protein QRY74_00175 [Chlamydia sp.]
MTKVTGSTIAAGFYGFIDDNAGKPFFPTRLFTVAIPVAQAIIGAQKGWFGQNELGAELNTEKLDLKNNETDTDVTKKDIKTIEKRLNNRGVAAVAGLIKGLFFGIIDALVFLYNPVAFARNNHPEYIANRQEYLNFVKDCLKDITSTEEPAVLTKLAQKAKKYIDGICLTDLKTQRADIKATVQNEINQLLNEYHLQKARKDINEKLDTFEKDKNLYAEMTSLVKKATKEQLEQLQQLEEFKDVESFIQLTQDQQDNVVARLKEQAEYRIALRDQLKKFEKATADDLAKTDTDPVLVELNEVTALSAEQKKHVIAETRKTINDLPLNADIHVTLSDIYAPIAQAKAQADAVAKIEKELKAAKDDLVKAVRNFNFTKFSKESNDHPFSSEALTDKEINDASDKIIRSIENMYYLEDVKQFSVNDKVNEIADQNKWTIRQVDNP